MLEFVKVALSFTQIENGPKTATNKADTAVLGGCGCKKVATVAKPHKHRRLLHAILR